MIKKELEIKYVKTIMKELSTQYSVYLPKFFQSNRISIPEIIAGLRKRKKYKV